MDRLQQIKDLLIQQYKERVRVIALLEVPAEQMQAVDDQTVKLLNERSLDTARGYNLDVIGKIVVLTRPYTDPDPAEVFTFENPSNLGLGFTDVPYTQVGGYFIGLNPIDNQLYNDDLYRFILRAKIIYNNTDCTLADMHRYIGFVFNTEASIIEGIGYIDLNIARQIGRQEKAILEATFPRAAGIRLGNLSYSVEPGAFGFTGDERNGGFGDLTDPTVGGVFSSLVID